MADQTKAVIGQNPVGGEIANTGKVTIGKQSNLHYSSTFRNHTGGLVEGSGTFIRTGAVNYSSEGGKVGPGIKHDPPLAGAQGLQSSAVVDPEELGILTFDGGYAQDALGSLDIQIGGTMIDPISGDTEYDRLEVVNGPSVLDGMLDVVLVNGFSPAPDDTFDVLVADGSLVGTFANTHDDDSDDFYTLVTPDGTWTAEYLRNLGSPSIVRLSNFVPVPEPATLGLLALGLVVVSRMARSRGDFADRERAI